MDLEVEPPALTLHEVIARRKAPRDRAFFQDGLPQRVESARRILQQYHRLCGKRGRGVAMGYGAYRDLLSLLTVTPEDVRRYNR